METSSLDLCEQATDSGCFRGEYARIVQEFLSSMIKKKCGKNSPLSSPKSNETKLKVLDKHLIKIYDGISLPHLYKQYF